MCPDANTRDDSNHVNNDSRQCLIRGCCRDVVDEIKKYRENKSDDDKDKNVLDAINALTNQNEKKWNMNDVEKLAKRLNNLYLGSIKTGRMATLASKMYANGFDEDSTIEDITKRLTTLKDQHNSGESSDSDNDVTAAFETLVKHDKNILVGDMASLAKKLYNLHIGSVAGGIAGGTTTGLIVNLARNIYKDINKQPSEITEKDITDQLESSKKQYNSKSNTDKTEDSDVYKAFKKLMEHNEKKLQDMSSLAKSISSVMQCWNMQLGAMQILASKMFGIKEWQLPYGSDLQTITYKLESLYNNHESEQKIDQGDVLALAFKDLIKQQPSITEDFSTLANFIYKVALSNSKTYEHHVKQMKKYINKYFFTMEGGTKKLVPKERGGRGPIVYVKQSDYKEYPGLYDWWSAITGWKQYNSNIPTEYGVKAEKDTVIRQELEKMGLSFDENLKSVSEAIKEGYVARAAEVMSKQTRDSSRTLASAGVGQW